MTHLGRPLQVRLFSSLLWLSRSLLLCLPHSWPLSRLACCGGDTVLPLPSSTFLQSVLFFLIILRLLLRQAAYRLSFSSEEPESRPPNTGALIGQGGRLDGCLALTARWPVCAAHRAPNTGTLKKVSQLPCKVSRSLACKDGEIPIHVFQGCPPPLFPPPSSPSFSSSIRLILNSNYFSL